MLSSFVLSRILIRMLGTRLGVSDFPPPNATPTVNSLESALPKNPPVTPSESALTISLHLKCFRIRTYKKRWGGGQIVNQRSLGWSRNPSAGTTTPTYLVRRPVQSCTNGGWSNSRQAFPTCVSRWKTGSPKRERWSSAGLFVEVPYSLSDTGSDSFLGDRLSNKATNSRPEEGIPTLPWRTISLALRSRP